MRSFFLLVLLSVGAGFPLFAQQSARPAPNELGRIPVLEYHLVGDKEGRWARSWQRFAKDLELLYARGYRPITVQQLVKGEIDLPAGLSPVVITFDDASPGQFRYLEKGGKLEVDPTSAVGIWLAMNKRHPDWKNAGVFCVLPSAKEGHAFFGEKGIQGQKTEWRLMKVRFLIEQGFEICNHTLWHANLSKMSNAAVQEQIARAQLAVDSAVAGYAVRSLALPLGIWPKDRSLLARGSWKDPKSGRTTSYALNAVLMVAGGPSRSPHDPAFDPMRIPRIQVVGESLEEALKQLDRPGFRYVSDGDPKRVTRGSARPQ